MARRYQRGSVVAHGNQWTLIIREDVLQPDGSVKRKNVRHSLGRLDELTEPLAEREADKIRQRINSPQYRPQRRGATFASFAEAWRAKVLETAIFKPSSKSSFRSILRSHLIPVFSFRQMTTIGTEDIQEFIAKTPLNGKTIRNIIGCMSTMWKDAKAWGYVTEDIFQGLRLPRIVRGDGPVFTAAQVRLILQFSDEPYRTLYDLLAQTGARIGEALALKPADIDEQKRLLVIRRAFSLQVETDTKPGTVKVEPISSGLLESLLRLCSSEHEFIFRNQSDRRMNADNVRNRHLWPLLKKLAIPKCGFHAFRHALGTEASDAGFSIKAVQTRLGHADSSTTLRYYVHNVDETARRLADWAAEKFAPDAVRRVN
jgi:integrase